jgi:hypothetical protein
MGPRLRERALHRHCRLVGSHRLGREDLPFRTKGQPTIDVLTDAYADGLSFDFACGDEVYGGCTELREFLEDRGQAYVLRVATSFTLTLAPAPG